MGKHLYTVDQLLVLAREKHGDAYDYDPDYTKKFKSSNTLVQITHKKCGFTFERKWKLHAIRGQGCPECDPTKKLDTATFIKRCEGRQFDYSKVVYSNMNTKVEIGCLKCGHWFWQTPFAHSTMGQGCPECKRVKLHDTFAFTLETFLTRVKENNDHFDTLDFSKTVYVNSETPIDVRCTKCNYEFHPVPTTLMRRNSGCPRCARVALFTHDEFVSRATEQHDGKYEYLSMYKLATAHVHIRCKVCDHKFWQTPNSHLNGKQGCPACVHRVSKPETEWLDKLGVPKECRQQNVPELKDRRFKVDALVDRVIYEFYGKYYHGDPRLYARDVVNKKCGKTMGELFDATIERFNMLKFLGYTVRFVWELDYDAGHLFSESHPQQILVQPHSS